MPGSEVEDKPIPLWQKLTALAVAIVFIIIIALTWNRLGADFWPLDRSFVGPNIVASIITWACVLIAGVLIWPPTRRRMHRFMDRKLDSIHEKLDTHKELHDANADSLSALHEKLDKLLDKKSDTLK
jgi:membrane protein YdbS with pleckstrin-like domain